MAAGNKRQVGGIYEQKAADYLSRQGFRIIEHNFYSRFRSEERRVGKEC